MAGAIQATTQRGKRRPRRSELKIGQLVRVKDADQIAATPDEDGTLDGLPLMPEMVPLCGKACRVRSSAHKTYDTVTESGLPRMDAAVHLLDAHCDGSAHCSCQSRCPLFFKDEILETLNADGKLRGLAFGHARIPFCGQRAVVAHRVEVRLDERTGRIQRMKNACIVLEGVTCVGRHHGFCARGIDQY